MKSAFVVFTALSVYDFTALQVNAPDFFSRALLSPMSSQHTQTYYSLTVYFFLAFALCGLLAGLAYLFSISTAQETEKRSEYECGFAPFDSATRLPFDVHFYLVGILFLIFDVEVALLFPWVLALRTVGWFGFYLMIAFLAILSLGFLYEWKRGALIWPTRYSKKNIPLAFAFTFADVVKSDIFEAIVYGPFAWPWALFTSVFVLHRLALLYKFIRASKHPRRTTGLRLLWSTAAVIFISSLFFSYYLSAALVIVAVVSYRLDANPFWPARAYWWARAALFSFPFFVRTYRYRVLRLFWRLVLALFFFCGAVLTYSYYPAIRYPQGRTTVFYEIFETTLVETIYNRNALPVYHYSKYVWFFILPYASLAVLSPALIAFVDFMGFLCNMVGDFDALAALLLFWTLVSLAFAYVYGGIKFTFLGNLYEKRPGDLPVAVTMRYLWIESLILCTFLALSTFLYLFDWDWFVVAANPLLITTRAAVVDGFYDLITWTLAAPGRSFDFIHLWRMRITAFTDYVVYMVSAAWRDLQRIPVHTWEFKVVVLWLLYWVRGFYYTVYIHTEETRSFYGKCIYFFSSLLYAFVMPFVSLYWYLSEKYPYARDAVITYYNRHKSAHTEEKRAQISASPDSGAQNAQKFYSAFPRIVVVDEYGNPTGMSYVDMYMRSVPQRDLMDRLMNEIASAKVLSEDLEYVRDILIFTAFCLALRAVYLFIRCYTLPTIPTAASAALIKKYSHHPRKAFFFGWLQDWLFAKPAVQKEVIVIDPYDNFLRTNEFLSEELAKAEGVLYALCAQVTALSALCLTIFAVNCYMSRKRQHHAAVLHGILTDGALVVVPQKVEKKSSVRAKKGVLLFASTGAVELLSPAASQLTSSYSFETPLLAEALLFTLICLVITKLSSDLGKAHNKRLLAFTSWRVLSFGLFATAAVYAWQFVFDANSASILGGYFATSRTVTLLKLITLLSAAFVLDASETFMRQHSRHLLEYPVMVALTTLFMLLLIGANHVMSAFLSLVGFSLGLYVLILYDANKRPSREAGLKYYYLSTLSSGLILYGVLLVYVLTGTGNFDELFLVLNTKTSFQENTLLRTALVLILIGFFFKLSAFPGHLWAADVYEGSPSPVTAFFMLPVKVVVLGAFVRLFSVALAPLATYWLPVLTLAVTISIIWGALASVQEKKVRRFLAYASINQMGFLLMGFTTDSDEGYQAALLYIGVYAVMTCAFLTVFLSARRQDGAELLYISDFRTLASRNWLVGWSLAIVLFSMAGIPPLGGFFAKYLVLLHAFEKNLIFEVVVGLATSLISTYYYLRIIKIIKFEQPDGAMPSSPSLTPRRQSQLFIAEALLWSFIVFAPAILGLTYTLAITQGPASFLV